MQSAHTFGCMSVPNGMELISTELFLIKDGPLGGTLVCGPWARTGKELSFLADGLNLVLGRNNFLKVFFSFFFAVQTT